MNKKRLGFLSTSGTLAAALTVFIVAGIGFFSGGVLFNPGPLNAKSGPPLGGVTSHAGLIHNCSTCHAPFWSPTGMADRCVACHTDVSAQWADAATLHGNLHKSEPALACKDCHPDHRGATAAMTDMSRLKIDHSAFGYSLAAHKTNPNGAAFACSDCHTNGYVKFDQAICSTCHAQIKADFMQAHLQAYGSNCLGCHDGIDTYGHAFDHSLAAFPLTGKHAKVACAQCHTGEHSLAAMKSTSQDCNSCHAKDDVHKGALGPGCATCHGPAGWTPSTFDHSTTAFPLAGKHQQVACSGCHPNLTFKGTPKDCYSCHAKDDVHRGDLGQACDQCHTPAGWTPASFDHNLAIFKLVGKHATVPCSSCHINNVFKGTPTDCYACHVKEDVHQGTLGAACSACHTPDGWSPSTFNHASASFQLTGAHASAACTSCHSNMLYRNTPTDCYSCHAKNDAHAGQFGTGCGSCHSTAAWLPATFNHNNSGFPLTGAHASAACASCHVNNVFKGTPTNCYACHAKNDAHNGQFGTSCGSCHSTTAWKPATFDHSIVFPLTGAHAGLSCNSCHTNGSFTGLSTACASCHADPAYHAGLFPGQACNQCHSTSAWIPASYNGPHPNTCDGPCIGHQGATCFDCHPANLMTSTCLKCHDSNNPGGGN